MAISTTCWKYIVFTYNILYAMSAVALFLISGILLYRLFVNRHFIGTNLDFPALVLVCCGIVSCFVSWVGWKATCSLHRFHVIMYGVLVLLVVLVEFSCFVWAMVLWDNLDVEVKTAVEAFFLLANEENDDYAISRWDKLQYEMQCCGAGGPGDYRGHGAVPWACCGRAPFAPAPLSADCAAVYQRGCGSPVLELARWQVFLVAMTALGAAIFQSIGVPCSFYFAAAIKESQLKQARAARNSRMPVAEADQSLIPPSAPPALTNTHRDYKT